MARKSKYDRAVEDLGNVVFLEHLNVKAPDQRLSTIFYVMGLGLTRDPYLVTGVANMWINCGKSQFHLPTGPAQVLRGLTGLVIPGREALLKRLEMVQPDLAGTLFKFSAKKDYVEVTCPWGNRLKIHEPGPKFPGMMLGMPYMEVDAPKGSASGIARFYQEILDTQATSTKNTATVSVGPGKKLVLKETTKTLPEYDGHHVAIYLANFSGPYQKLLKLGLVTEESDQHQYRFLDIVDPKSKKTLVRLEHEVRSMRHPLYAREHTNRNPAISNRTYAPGHQDAVYASAPVSL
ncbi:MAG: hypothetical protein VW714_03975 [Rhodospirillales bacterium]